MSERIRGALIVVSVLAAGLAGCLSDTGTEASNVDDANTVPQSLELAGCTEQVTSYPVAYEDAEPYLPPGFEAAGAPVGKNTTLILATFLCTEPRSVSLFFPWLATNPPDHLANPDAFYHAVSLPCLADPTTVELLRAWGAPCREGDIQVTEEAGTPAGAVWTLTAEGPDASVTLTGTGAATNVTAGPELIPLFHAIDGQLCAVTDLDISVHKHWDPGPSNLEVEGSPPFPIPLEEPGNGLLAPIPFELTLTYVEADGVPASTAGACPSG